MTKGTILAKFDCKKENREIVQCLVLKEDDFIHYFEMQNNDQLSYTPYFNVKRLLVRLKDVVFNAEIKITGGVDVVLTKIIEKMASEKL